MATATTTTRKIRGFKLALRLKEVVRRSRKDPALAPLAADEVRLQGLLDQVSGRLEPAVLFGTFPASSKETARLAPIPGLAHTVAWAWLGPALSPYIAERRAADAAEGRLLELAAEHALEEALRFVVALLAEDAAEERCELSPHQALSSEADLAAAAAKLPPSKIGLEAAASLPPYATAVCLSWIALPRSRRAAAKAKPAAKKT